MENLNLEKIEVGLHKFLNESQSGVDIPAKVQVYLCGMIDRIFNPTDNYRLRTYVVGNIDELERSISELMDNAVDTIKAGPSYVTIFNLGKYNGEFHTMNPILQGKIPKGKEIFFPQTCFSYAMRFAGVLKRNEEHIIFGNFAISLDKYVEVLHQYFNQLNSGKIEVTRDDYSKFRDYIINTNAKKKKERLVAAPQIKEEKIDDLII